jgi:preprotein translocase subunit SecA
MNKQREVIYAERRRILAGESVRDFMLQTLKDKVDQAVDQNAPENVHPSEWDLQEILNELEVIFPVADKMPLEELEKLDREAMRVRLNEIGIEAYENKERELTPELMRVVETKYIMLPIIDRLWVDHLYVMDALKTGIGLRGYGQKDPRVEYEKEAYEIFEDLKGNIADEALKAAFHVVVETQDPNALTADSFPGVADGMPNFEPIPNGALAPLQQPDMQPSRIDPNFAAQLLGPPPGGERPRDLHTNRDDESPRKPTRAGEKVGRNDLCPCGSGKKFKRCHGVVA